MTTYSQYTAMRRLAPTVTGTTLQTMEAAPDEYQYPETRELVQLVREAADLLQAKGGAAFTDFRTPGSRWRQDETYIFVLDPDGYMLVHADPEMEGKNKLHLLDVNGKPIVQGLIAAATASPDKPEGWYHYEWPEPEGLLPRWKSSYVRLVTVPSGKKYIVGSGMYNNRMEREFVVDMVKNAVAAIGQRGEQALDDFRDPAGPYRAKDAYIFVIDFQGTELLNPAFPNLEGQNMLDIKDTEGKPVNREMIRLVKERGAGWLDYMWPKPGESVSTQKSAYVQKATLGEQEVMVGCGVYLADAPRQTQSANKMTAQDLVNLVHEAAALLEQKGEAAFPEMRQPNSKWLHDEIYFWVWTMDGIRAFHPEIHPEKPESEGKDVTGAKDVIGKPYGKLFLEAASSPAGEGWVHCMWPKPFEVFPSWKSCFVKRVKFPSGKEYLVGSGIYDMQMSKPLVEDIVNRAAALVEERGQEAFAELRDKTGPFYFMDTYVFVQTPDGTELVNPAQPSLEGKNLMNLRDLKGNLVVKEEIAAVMQVGSCWLEQYWYKPGDNTPTLKQTFVRQAQHGNELYIIGSGIYMETNDADAMKNKVRKISWEALEEERMHEGLSRQMVSGEKATLSRLTAKDGAEIPRHAHPNEEYMLVTSGTLRYQFDDSEVVVNAGDVLIVPPDVPHSIRVEGDASFFVFFAPAREDWLRGEDQYLRR